MKNVETKCDELMNAADYLMIQAMNLRREARWAASGVSTPQRENDRVMGAIRAAERIVSLLEQWKEAA